MGELTNKEVQKLIHQTLDPIMRPEGFRRSGRTYYKQLGDVLFVLNTSALGAHFSSITNWPAYAFSVDDGIWIDGISPGVLNRYPKKKDRDGTYIPKAFNTFHINCDPDNSLKYGIYRLEAQPYTEIAPLFGITNPAEMNRRDIWVMPDVPASQAAFLEELKQQIEGKFLNCYREYTDLKKLESLILDGPRQANVEKGFDDNTPITRDHCGGNFHHYLDYAVLFHQRYGPEEKYLFYLNRMEAWAKVNNRKIPACYYCGCGNGFKL